MRYHKNKLYIGARDQQGIYTAKRFFGAPDPEFRYLASEYTECQWDRWRQVIQDQAADLGRQYVETVDMITSILPDLPTQTSGQIGGNIK